MSTLSNSTNIFWQESPVGKLDRQKLLNQKGCVVWITGLSGSGKSTLACSLSRELHSRGKLSYILDGDNLRHGLNKNLGFKPEDRTENIRRVGEVAKLFADAGLICIASLISPYRKDRDACRAMLPDANFIEVFMNMPLELCEARDTKGLYKLARSGKIKGKTLEYPTALKDLYPALFAIAVNKEAMISEMVDYDLDGGGRSWNLCFRRAFQDWETGIFYDFFTYISSKLPRGGDDTMIWQLNRNGVFDVRSFYNSLLAAPVVSFPWKSIWCVKVPKRVAFFLWTAARGGLLTIDNLVKKTLPLVNWCCLCRCEEETVDHLLIHCFTGIDDPYEPPLSCEIEIQQKDGVCTAPGAMAGRVVSYLEEKGYLQCQ
uniref:Adenylyl-sulfate kinase n=1 Tax=Quercus lobata TaxID=97700 RepID=A0A7N2M298_QUELO